MNNLKTKKNSLDTVATKDVLLVSIPNTGTRFLKERLKLRDYVHACTAWHKLVQRCQINKYIIAPLRDPEACWKSTVRRRTDSNLNIERFFRAWFQMHALSLIFDIDFIPVDLQQDDRITDWSHVGNDDPTVNDTVPEIYLDYLYELPFVKKYYGN